MADVVQHRDVGPRHQFAIARRHVGARDRIGRAVDQFQRHARILQRADPARAVDAAFDDVADEPVHHRGAAVGGHQRPERVDQRVVGRRARAEDAAHRARDRTTAREPSDERAQRRQQQALDQRGPMRLGKQAAVQQRGAAHPRPLAGLGLARQQFLRHRVAVVVGEHVVLGDAFQREHVLEQVGLFHQRIVMACGLVGQPEADHVQRDEPPALGQRRPQRLPVPRCRRKAVNQHEHGRVGAPTVAREDRVAAPHDLAAGVGPIGERDMRHRRVGK